MKTSLLKITKVLALLSFLYLAACAPADSTTVMNAAGNGNSNNGSGNVTNCSTATTSQGKIYDPAYQSNPTAFRTAVANFVSATLNPSALGDVSGNPNASTGIKFTGSFVFDSAGQLNANASNVDIQIYDSLVGTTSSTTGKPITAYPIEFSTALSGSYTKSTGAFTVTFKDSYGQVVFTGTVHGQTTQGTVTFANVSAVDGGGPRSGTLGTFLINTCSLIK